MTPLPKKSVIVAKRSRSVTSNAVFKIPNWSVASSWAVVTVSIVLRENTGRYMYVHVAYLAVSP